MDRPLVAPAPSESWQFQGHDGQIRWYVYSTQTGLIVMASDLETARARYAAAEPERKPVDYHSRRDIPSLDKEIKLDFSIFHPLDHWAFSPTCRSFYGGGRRHLEMWWFYQPEGFNPRSYWLGLRCRLGHHRPVDTWRSIRELELTLNAGGICFDCFREVPRPWTDQSPTG